MTLIFRVETTDVAYSALKLQHSDSSGSGYADVTGADFSAALPGASDSAKYWVWNVDLRGKKQYYKVVATVGNGSTGSYLSAHAILSRKAVGPLTASDRGAAQQLFA